MITSITSILFSLAIKSTIILLIVFFITWAIKRLSAAERHLVWSLAFASILLLPVLELVIPKYQIPFTDFAVFPTLELPIIVGSQVAGTGTNGMNSTMSFAAIFDVLAKLSVADFIILVYMIVAACLILYIGYLYYSVNRVTRTYVRINDINILTQISEVMTALGINRQITIYENDKDCTPWVWGVFQPRIMLPRGFSSWSQAERNNALVHELSHVQRYDLLNFFVARLGCCLYWFNPLAWIGYRKMMLEAEKACDDRVLVNGSRASLYADQLMQLATSVFNGKTQRLLVASMASPTSLSGRIRNILDGESRRELVNRNKVLLSSAITLMFSVSLVACEAMAERVEASESISPDTIDREIQHQGREGLGSLREKLYRYQEEGETEKAITVLQELKSKPDMNDVEMASINRALAYNFYELERYQEAINACEEILALDAAPRHVKSSANLLLAQLFMVSEDYAAVIKTLNNNQDVSTPLDTRPYLLKAQAYYQLQQHEDALTQLKSLRELLNEFDHKPDVHILMLMMAVYKDLGEQENFNKTVEEARQLYPDVMNKMNMIKTANEIKESSDYMPIVKIAPVYPRRAEARGLEGYAVVEFTVTTSGNTSDIKIVDSSHRGIFDRSSLEAAEKLKFKPRVVDGEAVEVPGVRFKYDYKLGPDKEA